MPRTCATEHSTLISGTHGRDRREERGIEKIDLQRARRYGMKEAAHHGREKYTYGGIVFIYDPWRKREVTSFPAPDASLATSGTNVVAEVFFRFRPAILESLGVLSAAEATLYSRAVFRVRKTALTVLE